MFQPCGPYQAMKILTKKLLEEWTSNNQNYFESTGKIQQDQNCQEEMYREDPTGSKLSRGNVQGRSKRIQIVSRGNECTGKIQQDQNCGSSWKNCMECSSQKLPVAGF